MTLVHRTHAALLAGLMLLAPAVDALAAGRTVSFPSLDGTPLAAQFYEASPRPAPGVVLVHMLARSKADCSSW